MQNTLSKTVKPKVSILCLAYNQEKYIRQALDSFIMQKTSFNFEVLIHDDASTDETTKIIREYEDKYPSIIKPIYQAENQYSKGVRITPIYQLSRIKGDYIALCEGDDCWTDENKLQLQVDFLEKHSDYSMCFHPVKVFFENSEEADSIFPTSANKKDFTVESLIKGNFIQTNSVMYRRQDYSLMDLGATPGDWYLHLYHAQFGKIGFINKVMSAYRRHENGIWWKSRKNSDYLWKNHGLGYIALFGECLRMFGHNTKYQQIINSQIVDMFNRLISVDEKHKTSLVKQALVMSPDCADLFIHKQNESIGRTNMILSDKKLAIRRLATDLYLCAEDRDNLAKSKSFIVGNLLLHPYKLPRRAVGLLSKYVSSAVYKKANKKDIKSVNEQYSVAKKILSRHENVDKKKMAVILHLYYVDMWPYFSEKLQVLNSANFNLFVSIPVGKEFIENEIKLDYPSAVVVSTPNRGRDVLPFVRIINAIKDKGYVYVLKIHSKKSKHVKDGNLWMDSIINNLIPNNKDTLTKLFKVMSDKQTGIVGPDGQYISLPVNYEANKAKFRSLLSSLKSKKVCRYVDEHRFDYGFFAGTMFWARIDSFKEILDKQFEIGLFDLEAGQIDSTFAHTLERAFCLIPELNGKNLYSINSSSLNQISYDTENVPDWSDVRFGKE